MSENFFVSIFLTVIIYFILSSTMDAAVAALIVISLQISFLTAYVVDKFYDINSSDE